MIVEDAFPHLFTPIRLAAVELSNRICVAPTTRQVARPDGTPTPAMRDYWVRRVRGGAAMVFTEGVYFTEGDGCKGYPRQSGICNDAHMHAWRDLTGALHGAGGRILLQLQHAGRLADPIDLAEGRSPVSASDTHAPGYVIFTDSKEEKQLRGWKSLPYRRYVPAHGLTVPEIQRIVEDFGAAAERGIACGFDGVEVHGANGFLIDQFFNSTVNQRSDEYGGSPTKRARLAVEVCRRVRDAIGTERALTLRLSQDRIDGIHDRYSGGVAEAEEIAEALRAAPVDALHWASFGWDDNRDPDSEEIIPEVMRRTSGKRMIVNGGITDGETAERIIAAGVGDLIAVGRPMFGNPDWANRVRTGEPQTWTPFHRRYVIDPVM